MAQPARRFSFRLITIAAGLALLLFPEHSRAQSTFDVQTFARPGIFCYSFEGLAWSFVPVSNLLVTAVYASAPQISFWKGTNQVMATDYTGPYYGGIFGGPATNFQAIPSLRLRAGQAYSVSVQNAKLTGIVYGFAFGVDGHDPFTNSVYLSQFASFLVSSNGQWTSPTTPPSANVNVLLIGPNFQFQPLPTVPLSIRDINMVGNSPTLLIQSDTGITNQIECKMGLHQTDWQVLTNLLVTQSPYTFIDLSTPPAPTRFYRVTAFDDTTISCPANDRPENRR